MNNKLTETTAREGERIERDRLQHAVDELEREGERIEDEGRRIERDAEEYLLSNPPRRGRPSEKHTHGAMSTLLALAEPEDPERSLDVLLPDDSIIALKGDEVLRWQLPIRVQVQKNFHSVCRALRKARKLSKRAKNGARHKTFNGVGANSPQQATSKRVHAVYLACKRLGISVTCPRSMHVMITKYRRNQT